jgi:hypothetical protein
MNDEPVAMEMARAAGAWSAATWTERMPSTISMTATAELEGIRDRCGQFSANNDERRPDDQQGERVADPHHAPSRSGAHTAALAAHHRGDRG